MDELPADYLDVNEPHINDILMRHKTLTETGRDLRRTVQINQDQTEAQHAELMELVKVCGGRDLFCHLQMMNCFFCQRKNDLILVYNSTLGTQQKTLERLKLETAQLEHRAEQKDNSGKERVIE